MMNKLPVTVLILLLSVASGFSQYVVYKTKEGVVLLSNKPSEYFTLDINGDKIVPVGMDSAPHPYFKVDGRFLQVMPVAIEEFKGSLAATDQTVLMSHLKYETDSFKEPVSSMRSEIRRLKSGKTALFWSFVPRPTSDKMQVFMSFRAGNYVVVLGSAVDGIDTKEAVEVFLSEIASSFHSSDRIIKLKFNPDGDYERD